jgi:hypothetical protein
MFRFELILVLFALVPFALAPFALAQEQRIEFQGVPFGATQAEVLARFPFLDCRAAPNTRFADVICHGTARVMNAQDFTYGGVPVTDLSLNFYNDTLASVFVTIDPQYFSTLSRAMVEGYGQPGKVERPEVQTGKGVTVRNEVLTWQRGDVRVVANKHFARRDDGGVVLRTDGAIEEFNRRNRESTRKGAKDL